MQYKVPLAFYFPSLVPSRNLLTFSAWALHRVNSPDSPQNGGKYKALFNTREDHSSFPRENPYSYHKPTTLLTTSSVSSIKKAAKSDNVYRILNSFFYLKQTEKVRRVCSHLLFRKTRSLPGGRENLCFAIHYLSSVTLLGPQNTEIYTAGVASSCHLL